MQSVTILHCADLHLGLAFQGLGGKINRQRSGDIKRTFLEILSLCNARQVDLLLVAGDLFEDWESAQQEYQFVYDGFEKIPRTTVAIVGGNHDPLTPEALYLTRSWPENVIVFPETYGSVVIDSLGVELWGASFSSPYQTTGLLAPAVPSRPEYIQIGLLHGEVGAEQSRYHPITKAQIASSGLAYLALGHIHKPSPVEVAGETSFAYPGSPEGQGFDELGPRGVYLGEISRHRVALDFVPVCQRMYLAPSVEITGLTTAHQMAQEISQQLLHRYGQRAQEHLYRILLTGALEESTGVDREAIQGLLSDFFYCDVRDKTSLAVDLSALAKEPTLKGIFAAKLIEQKENTPPQVFEQALKLGLQAFYGEVTYDED